MRNIILASVVVTLVFLAIDRGRAQSTLQGGIFFAPNAARSVTLSHNGDLLASFNVPKGTFLSVSYDDKQPHAIAAGRWEFHGDIAVRTQPASAAFLIAPGCAANEDHNYPMFRASLYDRCVPALEMLVSHGADVNGVWDDYSTGRRSLRL